MISNDNKQLLLTLKESSDFLCFLGSLNSSIDEFDKVLYEVLEASNGKAPFYSFSFMPEVMQQLNLDLTSSNNIQAQTCIKHYLVSKQDAKLSTASENCTETSVSLDHPSRNEQKIRFKVIKNEKPRKAKNSRRTDCMRKKVKSMFHRYVITKLNNLQGQNSEQTWFKPLPKILSYSLNLKENKQWIEMSLREIMISNSIQKSGNDKMNMQHNLKVLEENKSESVDAFLEKKWETVYEEFLQSPELSEIVIEMEKEDKIYANRILKYSSSLVKFINRQ